MATTDAAMIIRRKPQSYVEHEVSRAALLVLKASGMGQAEIEREAMRELSYTEELVLAEF